MIQWDEQLIINSVLCIRELAIYSVFYYNIAGNSDFNVTEILLHVVSLTITRNNNT